MKTAAERFLTYIAFDTGSDHNAQTFPSTAKQKEFAATLVDELKSIGIVDAKMDDYGYVYARIPSNVDYAVPTIGLIAHMDTVSEPQSFDIKPRIVYQYDGGDVVLNEEKEIMLRPSEYPSLYDYKGQDLIVTDGTTILGGDDKAGIAAIITGLERVLADNAQHGEIRIAFTPDEEIGRGTNYFDVAGFGADFAYTLDGGKLGHFQYESFNGASATVTIEGRVCHLGRGKSRGLINSMLIAMEFHGLLPVQQNPAYTEGHEGYFHLDQCDGSVSSTKMMYKICDFDRGEFQKKKDLFQEIAAFLNRKHERTLVRVECKDLYYNMHEKLKDKQYIIDRIKRALRSIGVEPFERPVRGSTDGSHLSHMGLPCPNLCMGSENAHSVYEYSSVQALEGVSNMVYALVTDLSDDGHKINETKRDELESTRMV